MGAWEMGSFENDDAADWVADLADESAAARTKLIRKALKDVLDGASESDDDEGYVEEPEGTIAIAAALLLRRACRAGHPSTPTTR